MTRSLRCIPGVPGRTSAPAETRTETRTGTLTEHLSGALVGALALMLVTAAPAAAQVTISGVIQPDLLPSICQQGTHTFECTNVRLQSGSIDLSALVGQNVRVTGHDVGVECVVYEVTAVQPAPVTLGMCGNPVPGCDIRFRSQPGALSQHMLFASALPDQLPVSPFIGTFLLGAPFLTIGNQMTGHAQGAAFDFTLPPTVALTGVKVYVQSARRDVGPVGEWQLSNAVCFTILGPSPPCFLPDC